jgi:RNA polymerase sigma factor (sigma-70 family)
MLDEALVDAASDIETIFVSDEQIQQVLDAIQELPFRQRDMLTLRYVLGWRVKAIADHLSQPENTISVNLRRALDKLQMQLNSHGITGEKAV